MFIDIQIFVEKKTQSSLVGDSSDYGKIGTVDYNLDPGLVLKAPQVYALFCEHPDLKLPTR